MDGILTEGGIEVGQYVFVEYDGRLTRSLPPQAHADRVGCYRLTGTVDLSLSMGVLLTGDPTFGDVIIRVDGSMPHLYQGMPITVYYNGVMAMSYPGQVTARHIVVPELTGVVSDRDSAGFTLTDAEGTNTVCCFPSRPSPACCPGLGGGCARRGGCGAGGRRGGRNRGECRSDC